MSDIILFKTDEGKSLLETSEHQKHFWKLINFFQPQINPIYCGIAAGVIVGNALRFGTDALPVQNELSVHKPEGAGGDTIPFRSFSQWTFLNEDTEAIKPKAIIDYQVEREAEGRKFFNPGLTVPDLAQMLEVHGFSVEVFEVVEPPSEGFDAFEKKLIEALDRDDCFVIGHYFGNIVGSATGGHFSPFVAYNKKEGRVLVSDVATHKQEWFWGDIKKMYKACRKKDSANLPGGLIIVSKN